MLVSMCSRCLLLVVLFFLLFILSVYCVECMLGVLFRVLMFRFELLVRVGRLFRCVV